MRTWEDVKEGPSRPYRSLEPRVRSALPWACSPTARSFGSASVRNGLRIVSYIISVLAPLSVVGGDILCAAFAISGSLVPFHSRWIIRDASSWEQMHSASSTIWARVFLWHANCTWTGSQSSEIQTPLMSVNSTGSSPPRTATRILFSEQERSTACVLVPFANVRVIRHSLQNLCCVQRRN